MSEFLGYLTLPYLLDGVWITLQLTLMGFGGGLVLGLLLAAMQLTPYRSLSVLARGYTTLYRGTPLILQLVFVFTVLPRVGVTFPPLVAGGVALALNEAVFFSEILRSGVRGVDPGQRLAARALGMVPTVLMRRVVAPQAGRAIVPALGNEAIATMKNSALASIIAVPELTLRTQQLASATFDYFEIYVATAVLYLALTGALTVLQLVVERWLDLDRVPRSGARGVRTVDDSADSSAGGASVLLPRPLAAAREAHELGAVLLRVTGLRKAYRHHEVLRGIDLTVREGEVVALLGPSGSGKSTLLRTINQLEPLDAGSVTVAGVRLGFDDRARRLPERSVARQRVDAGVGMVFQQFNLFHHLSVRENVAGPLRWSYGFTAAEAADRADELLAQVGLTDRAEALPRHLSGGQQQRVGIARALGPRPRVLLLDEPTSALDPELVAEVLAVIQDLARGSGLTMVIATHQLRFARAVADRAVFMSGGVVVEEGPPAQVLDNPREAATRRFVGAIDVAEV